MRIHEDNEEYMRIYEEYMRIMRIHEDNEEYMRTMRNT